MTKKSSETYGPGGTRAVLELRQEGISTAVCVTKRPGYCYSVGDGLLGSARLG